MSRKKKLYSDADYIEYMKAYDEFYKKRCKILGKKGCPKLDSQFSENLAASKVGFKINHTLNLDGVDDKGETYEVKGTGYSNTKVHFSNTQADHVIWVKATPGVVYIYEIDNGVYGKLNKKGFVDLKSVNHTYKDKLVFGENSSGEK